MKKHGTPRGKFYTRLHNKFTVVGNLLKKDADANFVQFQKAWVRDEVEERTEIMIIGQVIKTYCNMKTVASRTALVGIFHAERAEKKRDGNRSWGVSG